MKNKTIWVIVSCLMVAGLLLASCAPAAPTTAPTTTPTTVPTTEKPVVAEKIKAPVPAEEPKYGGIINILTVGSFGGLVTFDPYRFESASIFLQRFPFENLVMGDWAIDRKEFDFPSYIGEVMLKYLKPWLLESWELAPDRQSMICHVRQGIRFQNKPPVNGREFTADDAVWQIERIRKSPFQAAAQYTKYIESTTVLDKYTFEIKFSQPMHTAFLRGILDNDSLCFIAKESVGKSGEIEDWRLMIGTGPFMINDNVPGSSITFERNPDYWGYDELHPENRLPYVDKVRVLAIADLSTRLAAFRTGKVDTLQEVEWRDAESLLRTNPEILSRWMYAHPNVYRMRVDKEPFTDVRVRQALNMAIDREEIVRTFYGGHAIPKYTDVAPAQPDAYTPYGEYPQDVNELLSYNPAKARQLLAEAGYPDGFNTHIDYTMLSHVPLGMEEVVQSYLAKIGVKAELNRYDPASYNALRYGRKHTAIILHWGVNYTSAAHTMGWLADPNNRFNLSSVNDPVFTAKFNEAMTTFDPAEHAKLMRELDMYIIRQAWYIIMPHAQKALLWQPWLKGYRGESTPGMYQQGALYGRIWVDRELKKKITGIR